MSVLSPLERKQVGEAIALAEAKTSGEIVVCSVAQSGSYRWVIGFAASIGWILGTLIAFCIHPHFWEPSGMLIVGYQMGIAMLFVALTRVPLLRRVIVRKSEMAERVHSAAIQVFVESGTLKTIERTGVLIYVSEFERRVEIIADEGIHSIVGDSYWKSQVDHVITGIREKRAAAAICEAVSQIGAKLAERFPPSAENPNELPDEPI